MLLFGVCFVLYSILYTSKIDDHWHKIPSPYNINLRLITVISYYLILTLLSSVYRWCLHVNSQTTLFGN